MPIFYDPNNLTPEQQANWAAATTEYHRIMGQRREVLREQFPDHKGDDLDLLGECLCICAEPHSKSALFARLLSGKPALAHPPPTSFSYPWYEVIEEPGPFQVMIGGNMTLGGQASSDQNANRRIVINQCAWAIVEENAPARRLRELVREENPDTAALHEVTKQDPLWWVKHSVWPVYRLYVGRATGRALRGALHFTDELLGDRNTKVLRVLKTGEERIAEQQSRIARAIEEQDTSLLHRMRDLADPNEPEFPDDPSTWDYVEYEHDDWFLAKD